MVIKEVNLREFIRNYLEYLGKNDKVVQVTRKNHVIGFWMPFEVASLLLKDGSKSD